MTDIEELRERAELLEAIKRLEEDDTQWTDIEELRERARLLEQIAEMEKA